MTGHGTAVTANRAQVKGFDRRHAPCEDVAMMTDYMRDTPSLGRVYCPGCEPEADPTSEILDVRWCESHALLHDGLDDGLVNATSYLSGSVEAGGDDNRRWCEVFHRRR